MELENQNTLEKIKNYFSKKKDDPSVDSKNYPLRGLSNIKCWDKGEYRESNQVSHNQI